MHLSMRTDEILPGKLRLHGTKESRTGVVRQLAVFLGTPL